MVRKLDLRFFVLTAFSDSYEKYICLSPNKMFFFKNVMPDMGVIFHG